MRDKIGEVFSGRVSGMANFGLFVTLDEVYIDGMVHISDLGEDYFNYHPELMAIIGERSGLRFKLGDKVTVKVARADLEQSRIDLMLINTESKPKRSKNKKFRQSKSERKKSSDHSKRKIGTRSKK